MQNLVHIINLNPVIYSVLIFILISIFEFYMIIYSMKKNPFKDFTKNYVIPLSASVKNPEYYLRLKYYNIKFRCNNNCNIIIINIDAPHEYIEIAKIFAKDNDLIFVDNFNICKITHTVLY